MIEVSRVIDVINQAPVGVLAKIAGNLGLSRRDIMAMTIEEIDGYRGACIQAVERLGSQVERAAGDLQFAELSGPRVAELTPEDVLRGILAEGTRRREGPILQSVRQLCGYRRILDKGFVICHRPDVATLIDIFEMANTECRNSNIFPAINAGDFNWWRSCTSAGRYRATPPEVIGFFPTERKDQGRQHGVPASIEIAALANILQHIDTRGGEDLFEDNWARTRENGIVLERQHEGLTVLTGCGTRRMVMSAAISPEGRATIDSARC